MEANIWGNIWRGEYRRGYIVKSVGGRACAGNKKVICRGISVRRYMKGEYILDIYTGEYIGDIYI